MSCAVQLGSLESEKADSFRANLAIPINSQMGLYMFSHCGTSVCVKGQNRQKKKKIEALALPDVQKYSKITRNIKAKETDHENRIESWNQKYTGRSIEKMLAGSNWW